MARLIDARVGAAWQSEVMLNCRVCARDLTESDFSDWGKGRGVCRECTSERNRAYGIANRERRNARLREWRRKNPEAARAKDVRARLMRKYGLTPAEVEEMRLSQGGRCLLCDSAARELVVDHDHDTGAVRGMLCRSCNTIVGQVEMSPLIVERLVEYLRHGVHPGLASSSKTSA